MESALMIAPPSFSASSSANADLPLAVGPAMRMIADIAPGSHDMSYVATLISHPDRPAVSGGLAARVAQALPGGREADWLAPGIAIDVLFEAENQTDAATSSAKKLAGALRDIIGAAPVDFVVEPRDARRKKLLVADMDSTMIGQECIDELA